MQFFPEERAWSLRSGGTLVFEPLEYGFKHFGTVPVSCIVQGCFSSETERLEPAVGSGSTGLYSCNASSFLKAATHLHQDHHLLFCASSLLVIHAWLLAHR